MEYKKFNLYEGVKISERVISAIIVLGLVALAVIIIAFAKPSGKNEALDTNTPKLTEYKSPININNTQQLIK